MRNSLDRRDFLKMLGMGLVAGGGTFMEARGEEDVINFLLITADDMNYDSPGCFGGTVEGITPHIDRLASEGLRFENGHVTIAVCQPSRQTLMTGRYPHKSGGEGFQEIRRDVPTLQEALSGAGYLNGIMGKVKHLAPVEKYCWDFLVDAVDLGKGRSPDLFYENAKKFFEKAKGEEKPFFLMANSADPHRPFPGSDQERNKWKGDLPSVRRTIHPDEVEVPSFLADIPEVRTEIAEYSTACHRCDETVGMVLKALDEAGFRENTLVMFLSDNGMAFPFAKTNCYLNSTKTPWIVRWPGKVRPGLVDEEHLISGIDYMPTILEAAGVKEVKGMNGSSFLPLLSGRKQKKREYVFTEFHETAGRNRYPMRCVQTKRFGYIVNFWADGETVFKNKSQSGRTFKAMQESSLEQAKKRATFFQHRVLEEFYNFENDPDALKNLIDDPEYAGEIKKLKEELLRRMKKTGDVAAGAFEKLDSQAAIEAFMKEQNAIGEARKAERDAKRSKGKR